MLLSSETKPTTMQEATARLAHVDTLALHFLRQQRHGKLQLVLHLHLRDIRDRRRFQRSATARRRHWPELVEAMYIRPSSPFMFCSMTWVTESSTTLADAPG